MPTSATTVHAIEQSSKILEAEVEAMRKRLESLEMSARMIRSEKLALQEEIEKLQARHDEDDAEITNILFEREKKRLERSDSGTPGCALASHEAADEIQRKEKLIDLEKLFIGSLEKRMQALPVEISTVDAAIEGVQAELTEVLERTGLSEKSVGRILESLEENETMEAFFQKGEALYQSDMRRIAELKGEIQNQTHHEKGLSELLKTKSKVVDKLLEEKRAGDELKKQIASKENDIRVTERSVRECMHTREEVLRKKAVIDTELEVADTHSKYHQARFSLKEDTDYLQEQYHSQNEVLHSLRAAKKGQIAHAAAIDRSIAILERAARVLGVHLPTLHAEVRAAMAVPPLASSCSAIVEAYGGDVDFYDDNAFACKEDSNAEIRRGYLQIIDAATAVLVTKGAEQTASIDEKYAELSDLNDKMEQLLREKDVEAKEYLEESIHTAQHADDLKQQIGAQQTQMFEELQEPMRQRLSMQRKLTESRYPLKK